jgi:ATP/maltotriose-dependent transcriptional regulator MalT
MPETQWSMAWCLARVALAKGRVRTGARYAREAAVLSRGLGQPRLLLQFLVPLAETLALSGDGSAARKILDEIDGLGVPPDHLLSVNLLLAGAWTALAVGDVAAARSLLEEAASLAGRIGDAVYEAAALHDLARIGHAKRVAPRLAELAEVIEGVLAPARAAHAAALAQGDADDMETVSNVFEAMGANLLAAEAAADAAVLWRAAGEPRKAAAAERRAHVLADRCEGARTPALTAVTARATLSARELEIARLAAAGVPNKEIAARLHLSLHTVQNRLHAAYERLGVQGRAELAKVLKDF